MQGKKIVQERKNELLKMLENTKDAEMQNVILKEVSLLNKRFALSRTKEEKKKYCKFCSKQYSVKSKVRIRTFTKNKKKKRQKIIVCGYCGRESRITL